MAIGMNAIGADFDLAETSRSFALGTVMWGIGKAYVYVQADGALTEGDVAIVTEAYQADAIDTTNSATARGDRVGVAGGTLADNEYGWVQVFGPATAINAATGALANIPLNSTATAGRLDDDATVGAEVVDGLVILATSASNTAAGYLNWPTVGATL